MQIQELKLLNFRNYEKLQIQFNSQLNVIYGKNGSGKTNLVEAIYVLALTRSFKQINDKTLIRNDTNLSKIEGIIKDTYQNTYKVLLSNEGKKVKIDNNKITKISDYISKINVVLFHPNDLKMIKDTPSIRRKYLNIAISQLNVNYLKKLNDYNKLIKTRNVYLKKMYLNGNSLETYLDVITEKLIDVGLEIYTIRKNYLAFINNFLTSIYKQITEKGILKVNYKSDYEKKTKEELLKIYKKNLSKDITFGKTNIGVHHDDLEFTLDNLLLKDYGSEGQQKNAVISWKLSEIAIIEKEKKVTPILILDDLLSELDETKIQNIFKLINKEIQTFITTTEIEKLNSLLKEKNYKKIHVTNGKCEEVI